MAGLTGAERWGTPEGEQSGILGVETLRAREDGARAACPLGGLSHPGLHCELGGLGVPRVVAAAKWWRKLGPGVREWMEELGVVAEGAGTRRRGTELVRGDN